MNRLSALMLVVLSFWGTGRAETKVNDSPRTYWGLVLPGPDGEWIVRWSDEWLGHALARFDVTGNRTYGPVTIEGTAGGSGASMVWNGTHIGWTYRVQNASNEQEIWFRLNDADGNLAAPAVMVYDAPGDDPCCPDVAWAEGEFIVGFTAQSDMGVSRELAMRRVSAAGALAGPVIPVQNVGPTEAINDMEVGRVEGALIATWYHVTAAGDISIEGAWFDPSGNVIAPPIAYANSTVDTVLLQNTDVFSLDDRAVVMIHRNHPQVTLSYGLDLYHILPDGTVALGPLDIGDPDLSPIAGQGPGKAHAPGGQGIQVLHRPGSNAPQLFLRRVSTDGALASASLQASSVPSGYNLRGTALAPLGRAYGVVWEDDREVAGEQDLFFDTAPAYELLAIGAGPSPTSSPQVDLHQPDAPAAAAVTSIAPYGAGGHGANVGAGDVDGRADTADEVLTGPGPGEVYGPQVRAFDWRGSPISKVNFYAYGTLKYGAKVQGALLDADATHEMLSGPGPGSVFGPHVRGWNHDGLPLSPIAKVNFFAYSTLKYGVNPSGGDVDGDGFAEILTGPGPGAIFGSHLRGFDHDGTVVTSIGKINTFVFPASDHGLELSAGDTDHDGSDEIAAAAGPAPGNDSRVAVYDYESGTGLSETSGSRFEAFAGASGGARLSFCQWFDRDLRRELLVSRGTLASSSSEVAVFDDAAAGFAPLVTFDPYPGRTHGATLAPLFVGF